MTAPTAAEIAEARNIMRALSWCAGRWDRDAKLVGNASAGQIVDSIRTLLAALDAAEAEKKSWQDAERELSNAYVRLRTIIPGALRTPHNPAPGEMWSIVESAAASLLLRAETAERERDEARERGFAAGAEAVRATLKRQRKEAPRG